MTLKRIVAFALACAAFAGPPAAAAAEGAFTWGVNGHPFNAYQGVTIQQQVAYLADTGLRSYRVNIETVESADRLAALIAESKANGVAVLPVITPALDLKKLEPGELYKASYAMAATLVGRFKDDVRVWELGNEMENFAILRPCETRDNGVKYDCAWGDAGGVSPLDYNGQRWAKVSAVLRGLQDGAVAADPTVRKAMGVAGWGHVGAFERMKQDGIKWDISVWHMYGEDPEWAFKILAGYGKPIWVTELNHPFGSQRGEAEQANGLRFWMKRLEQLAPKYRIEAAHLYELMDETYWQPSYEAFMGLVRLEGDGEGSWRPGAPKPAYFAVREHVTGRPGTEPPPRPLAATAYDVPPRRCDLDGIGKRADGSIVQRVNYSYCLVLGRGPDSSGLGTWIKTLANDPDPMGVIIPAMLKSDEFRLMHAPIFDSHGAFVTAMYEILLGRTPDPGAQAYVEDLQNGRITRSAVQRAILSSAEFRSRHAALYAGENPRAAPVSLAAQWRSCDLGDPSRTKADAESQVDYTYCLILGRAPDDGGRQAYASQLAGGLTPQSLALGMIGSDEFRGKVASLAADDATAVRLVHVALLGREPDAATLKDMAERLRSRAWNAQDVARKLVGSPEFRDRSRILFSAN